MIPKRVIVGSVIAAWSIAAAVILAAIVGVIPPLPSGVATLAVGLALGITIGAVGLTLSMIMTRNGRQLSQAVQEMNRNAIVPVREAFLHGIEYAGSVGRADGAQVIALPRQLYTATATEPQTADGVTTVELPLIKNQRHRKTGRPQPKPRHLH